MLIGIFLFLKQIVDVIYELKVLDILMVVFALALIGMQSVRLLKDSGVNQSGQNVLALLKKQVMPIDYAVLVMACLYAFSFLRDIHAINSIVKIESAFLIYILGRVYGNRIIEKGRWLAAAGYIVIYANLIYVVAEKIYIKRLGEDFPWNEHGLMNGGALYYYKTDLAIGLILASIFIYLYSKKKILKWITLFPVNVFTIYDSKARMGKVILGSILVVFIIREVIKLISKNRNEAISTSKSDKKYGFVELIFTLITLFVIAIFVAIQVTPIKQYDYYGLGLSEELMTKLENICHSRHIIWWDTFHNMANQGFFIRCIGIDLNTFPEFNSPHMMAHCLYLNMFFAIGYIGIFAFIAFLYMAFKAIGKVIDKDIRFIVSVLLMVFLIFGISMDPIEYTQISWFPFMFVGVAVSMASVKKQG